MDAFADLGIVWQEESLHVCSIGTSPFSPLLMVPLDFLHLTEVHVAKCVVTKKDVCLKKSSEMKSALQLNARDL